MNEKEATRKYLAAIEDFIDGLRPKVWERATLAILLPAAIFFYGWWFLTVLRL